MAGYQRSQNIVPRDPILWGAILGIGAVLTTLAMMRYQGYNAGVFDLGNMYQAITSIFRGQPLIFTQPFGPYSRLAGHVELIYIGFAPLLALWRDPQALLLAQAMLAASGAVPAYRIALRRLDSVTAARCAAFIYLLYPVAQTAVLFDFHGDTLAMPLLMFALDAADRRAWRAFACWVALALASKVYIAAPVAGIGAYLLLWGGQRRAGLITGLAAVAYGAFIFFFLRELFAPAQLEEAVTTLYTSYYFGQAELILLTLPGRVLSLIAVIGPALFLAWRGWRWLLVGSPLVAATLLSSGPGSGYHYQSHHYAAAVPFLVMATIDGAGRLREAARAGEAKTTRRWLPDLAFTTTIVALCWVALVDQPLNPRFWLAPPGAGLDPSRYGISARDAVKDGFLAEYVPAGVPLAASMFLGAHLADRETLYTVRYPDDPGGQRLPSLLPKVDYVLADALFDWRLVDGGTVVGGADYEQREIGQTLRDSNFSLVAARDGMLLFQRDAPQGTGLAQEVASIPANDLPAQTAYFGPIRLLGAEIRPLGARRYSANFAWTTTEAPPADRALIPVSSLEGVAGARFVHLPAYVLKPTTTWGRDEIVREQFELEIPADLPSGRYVWRVAWHDPRHPEAYATGEASLLAGSTPVAVATIEVTP